MIENAVAGFFVGFLLGCMITFFFMVSHASAERQKQERIRKFLQDTIDKQS